MKAKHAGIVLGIVSAIGVLLLVAAATERKSPGPVATVHARIADLDGGQACAACHGGWFGDMTSACSKCHADIARQRQDRKGLHGGLDPALAAACSTCHGEHHGGDFPLVNRLAFTQAGVVDPQQFDHERIGYRMAGAHTVLACTTCHQHADAPLLPEGQKRYLGLSQDCATCHRDPHEGAMKFACASCHDQESFASVRVSDHDRWLRLDGAHAHTNCRDCHATDSLHALERLVPGDAGKARQCADCHASPHGASFLTGNIAAAKTPAKAVCAQCHLPDLAHFADARTAITPAQHAHGGFALAAPHAGLACDRCHADGGDWRARHPGRQATQCNACHADPHGGQFAGSAFAGAGCTGCHEATHWTPHAFDRDHHARTALPLDGKHVELACERCHGNPAPGEPRQFHGTPSRCEGCHTDAHDGAFAAHAQQLATTPRGSCAQCHTTQAFADLSHDRFDHRDWTGFAIDGAHAQIECTDCHARTPTADGTGRRFGRIPRHGEGFGGCATCHGDPHGGQFERPGVPATIDGRRGCERCHDTASFRALPHGFDHAAFAGYPLTGKHAQLDCAACHERLPSQDASGRTVSRAKGRECADCHRDPHQKQFERLGTTDCARCHKSTTAFATLSFRHNLDSRFPLGEQHAKVACALCHKPEPILGVTVTRYKPLPVECIACHGREDGGAPSRRRRQ